MRNNSNFRKPEVVVITGAGAGLGRAIVQSFAKRGAYIGLVARGKRRYGGYLVHVGIVFMFVTNTFIGTLNAIDRQSSFAWAAFWSMIFNVAGNLVAIPLWGYLGASAMTVLTEVFLCTFGFCLLRRHLFSLRIDKLSWRIVLAGLVMGAGLFPFHSLTGWLVLPVIAGAAVVYGLALILLRAVDRDDWRVVIPQNCPRSDPRTGDHHRMHEHRLLLEQRHGQGRR